jgi:hypothetical protein
VVSSGGGGDVRVVRVVREREGREKKEKKKNGKKESPQGAMDGERILCGGRRWRGMKER